MLPDDTVDEAEHENTKLIIDDKTGRTPSVVSQGQRSIVEETIKKQEEMKVRYSDELARERASHTHTHLTLCLTLYAQEI